MGGKGVFYRENQRKNIPHWEKISQQSRGARVTPSPSLGNTRCRLFSARSPCEQRCAGVVPAGGP
jgi:hypothetical protein